MADGYADVPARPPSEAEWEDLLLRVEIAPRALRNTVEDARASDPRIRKVAAEAARWEGMWEILLEKLRQGEPLPKIAVGVPEREDGREDVEAMLEVFSRLRGRNFAMVQRRGLDVWDWAAPDASGKTVTAYRLLTEMLRNDGRLLAAARDAARAGGAAC
jgi:hypothetical protein